MIPRDQRATVLLKAKLLKAKEDSHLGVTGKTIEPMLVPDFALFYNWRFPASLRDEVAFQFLQAEILVCLNSPQRIDQTRLERRLQPAGA